MVFDGSYGWIGHKYYNIHWPHPAISAIPAARKMRSQMRVPHFRGWGVAPSIKGSSSLWRKRKGERGGMMLDGSIIVHPKHLGRNHFFLPKLECCYLSWGQLWLWRSRYINNVGFPLGLLFLFFRSPAHVKVKRIRNHSGNVVRHPNRNGLVNEKIWQGSANQKQ